MSSEIPNEWYFITAPQQISWTKDSRMTVIEPYGTNNPYVHYGTTKLRTLNLNDVMVEGFSDGKSVENNVIQLEACMRMVLDTDDGYASPYVWRVYAGGKSYGTYLITNVNVNEEIRDLQGRASRAKVDISFQEVSPYQVSSGIDITAEALTGSFDPEVEKQVQENAKNNEKDNQENASKDKNDKNGNKGDSSSSSSSSGGGGGGGGPEDPYTGGYIDSATKGGT
jgi:hypothetical protein